MAEETSIIAFKGHLKFQRIEMVQRKVTETNHFNQLEQGDHQWASVGNSPLSAAIKLIPDTSVDHLYYQSGASQMRGRSA